MLIRHFGSIAACTARITSSHSLLLQNKRLMATNIDYTVGLNEEQVAFQQVATDFSRKEILPHAHKWDQQKIFPSDVLQEAASLGFGGVYVKDDVGGSGLGRKDAAIIFEALARGCVSTTAYLTIHNMCCWMIDEFGTEEQRKQWLPELCSMEKFASYCLTEPGSGSDASSLQTKAELRGDMYYLTGEKAFISGGGRSDVYLIMARTGGSGPKGISCFIVPKESEGISYGSQLDKLGWNSQPTAPVILENCKVPKENMLGMVGMGFKIAMQGLDGGRINIGTTALGGAAECLELAADHISSRKQFGRTLDQFQYLRFKIADMATELTAARLLVFQAAEMYDEKHPARTMHCAMAKRFATDVGFNICNNSLQMYYISIDFVLVVSEQIIQNY
mmetsp:Transcript_6205/g.8774  ORF Transcript_6205/g.8774 Transcript_6205/m.8774 type:complete len:391 (-) Transcript_6205:551-1723(-)